MGPRPQGRGRAPGSRLRPARTEAVREHRADHSDRPGPPAETVDAGLRGVFEEAARVPPPNAQEQAELLQRAGSGDEAARATLLKTKLEMVGRLAAARAEKGLPFGDLVQEGSIGVMGAIDYFPHSGRDDFDTFAAEQAGAQMDAALENEAESAREARRLVEAAEQYEGAQLALATKLGRLPTPAELAKKLEWTQKRTDQIGEMVAEARRIHDEELLQYLDPDAADASELEAEDG
jgi:DNA-directed RNA polymerase sigma subunit (sigma70/sigma32)